MGFLERSIRLQLVTNPHVPSECHRLYDNCVNLNADKNFEFWPGKQLMTRYSGGKSNLFRHLKKLLRLNFFEKVDRMATVIKPGPRGPQAYPQQVYRVVYPPPTGGPLANNGGSISETTGGSSETTGGPQPVSERVQEQVSTTKEHIRTSSAARSLAKEDSIPEEARPEDDENDDPFGHM